mmetsp:Transcript_14463/g.45229  ORF Transcript_14463/g.45229 Transcript_14463/m.45229 type:complete len:617 (+) Transcript_14463:323-2173(+)
MDDSLAAEVGHLIAHHNGTLVHADLGEEALLAAVCQGAGHDTAIDGVVPVTGGKEAGAVCYLRRQLKRKDVLMERVRVDAADPPLLHGAQLRVGFLLWKGVLTDRGAAGPAHGAAYLSDGHERTQRPAVPINCAAARLHGRWRRVVERAIVRAAGGETRHEGEVEVLERHGVVGAEQVAQVRRPPRLKVHEGRVWRPARRPHVQRGEHPVVRQLRRWPEVAGNGEVVSALRVAPDCRVGAHARPQAKHGGSARRRVDVDAILGEELHLAVGRDVPIGVRDTDVHCDCDRREDEAHAYKSALVQLDDRVEVAVHQKEVHGAGHQVVCHQGVVAQRRDSRQPEFSPDLVVHHWHVCHKDDLLGQVKHVLWNVVGLVGHKQRACHTAAGLQRRRAVSVRMVPQGPRRVVVGEVIRVVKVGLRLDVDEDVVAGRQRRDARAVRVEIGAVWRVPAVVQGGAAETVARVERDGLGCPRAIGIGRRGVGAQCINEAHVERLAALDADADTHGQVVQHGRRRARGRRCEPAGGAGVHASECAQRRHEPVASVAQVRRGGDVRQRRWRLVAHHVHLQRDVELWPIGLDARSQRAQLGLLPACALRGRGRRGCKGRRRGRLKAQHR